MQQGVVPLVQLEQVGIPNLKKKAIKVLESPSVSQPKEFVNARAIIKLSKVIFEVDP